MFERIKRTLTSIVAAALLAGCAAQNKPWMNISPGYAPKRDVATVRVEGGTKVTPHASVYGFADFDSTPQNKTDLQAAYAEVRAAHDLGEISDGLTDVHLLAEYNGGTGIEDTVRFGVGYTPQIASGNFTLLKLLPFETQGSYGPQIGVFTSQQITKDLGASLFIDYNINPKTIYSELELNYTIHENWAVFIQGRGFGTSDSFAVEPVMGIRYNITF